MNPILLAGTPVDEGLVFKVFPKVVLFGSAPAGMPPPEFPAGFVAGCGSPDLASDGLFAGGETPEATEPAELNWEFVLGSMSWGIAAGADFVAIPLVNGLGNSVTGFNADF